MKRKRTSIGLLFKILLFIPGFIFITLCVLAFTSIPFWAYYSLGTSNSKITQAPTTIILLSGSGMPSADGLIRALYTAQLTKAYPNAKVIIAMPGNITDSTSDPIYVANELILRGTDTFKIIFENKGRNTREQAQLIASGKTPLQLSNSVMLVTSPEHMKRAILAFRKCGFTNVCGFPTFEYALTANLTFKDSDLKGNQIAPPIGNNLQVRYQFWNHLKLEVAVIREYFALTYYKLRGWI